MKSNKIINKYFLLVSLLLFLGIKYVTTDKLGLLATGLVFNNQNYKSVNMISKTKDFKGFESIDINVDINNIEIIASDKYKIELKYREDESAVNYEVIEDVLTISQEDRDSEFKLDMRRIKKDDRSSMKIYIPKDKLIKNIDIDCYVADIKLTNIVVDSLEVDCQVSNITISDILVKQTMDIEDEIGNVVLKESKINKGIIDLGTGNLNIRNCKGKDFCIEIDTGDIKGNDFNIKNNVYINCNIGNVSIEGDLLGRTNISSECGNIKLKISGKPEEYNYNVSCNLGDSRINGKKYDKGIIINNNKKKCIDIKCDIGYVKLDFK